MVEPKKLNVSEITKQVRIDLLNLLENIRGKKTLVIDKGLLGPIGLFLKFSTLQEYGVDKLFVLENGNVQSAHRNVIFLSRGEKPSQVQLVTDQIKAIRSTSQIGHEFTVIWVPRRTLVGDQMLEESGVLGDVSVHQCPLYFVPLETDLLSLELQDSFTDIYLHKDPTPIYTAAKALMMLQKQVGLFSNIQGKGDNAKRLADLLLRMRTEDDVSMSSDPANTYLSAFGMMPSTEVDSLIIIDRAVDFPTTLMTQLTYEGLIDEKFGINHNQAEVDAAIIGSAPQTSTSGTTSTAKRKVQLDSTDKLYPDLRDSNFAVVGPRLNKIARRLQTDYETRHKTDQSISDLKSFVAKLPSYQAEQASLKLHTALAEDIMRLTRSSTFGRVLELQQTLAAGADTGSIFQSLEELMAKALPISTILRIACLESCIYNGIRQRDLDILKQAVLHAYGPQHLLTLSNLAKMGLLTTRAPNTGYLNPLSGPAAGSTMTDYGAIRKSLRLFLDEVDEAEPKDMSYTFSGYAPLSVRLVQCALQKSFLTDMTKGADTGDKSATSESASTRGAHIASRTQKFGWTPFDDALARIKGATFHHLQKPNNPEAAKARNVLKSGGGQSSQDMTTIVFYLGGITYAEIAALRFVAKHLATQQNRKLLIATTGIISGERVMDAAVEKRTFSGAGERSNG